MTIREAAHAAQVSPRTLRYYEELKLIEAVREENGYREYDENTIRRVRLIRAYRELQFSLEEIRRLLDAPRMQRDAILENQIKRLETKRQVLDNRIAIARNLRMMGPERFVDVDFSQVDAQMQQAQDNLNHNEEWKNLSAHLNQRSREEAEQISQALLQHLANIANAPASEVSAAIEALQTFITQNLYSCTPAILQYYARAFGGDGLLAQTLDEAGGKGAAQRFRERVESMLK